MPSYIRIPEIDGEVAGINNASPKLMLACADGQHSEPTTPDSFSFAGDATRPGGANFLLGDGSVREPDGPDLSAGLLLPAVTDPNLLLPAVADPNLLLPYNDFDIA